VVSVVQGWLAECTLKQQTVLLSALRGCDGKYKEDYSKPFTRKLRSVLLKNAGGLQTPGKFMADFVGEEELTKFVSNLDHYPMHWLMHFTHAVEIVGFKHPVPEIQIFWFRLYIEICKALHLNPETEDQLDKRLADIK
jgi:hypothetical protein